MVPDPKALRAAAGVAVLALALTLAACGDDEETTSTTTATDQAAEACEEVPAAEPKRVKLKAPKEQVKPGEKITATVETNCGDFQFALDTKNSPEDGELVRPHGGRGAL